MDKFERAAEAQLEAYNNRDIDAFLKWYTEDVTAIDMDTNKVLLKGKDEMRKMYTVRFENTYLKCTLKNRMVLNRTIIDHEIINYDETNNTFEAIAIYDVDETGLISTIWFTKGKL